jgi:hypothetical protein
VSYSFPSAFTTFDPTKAFGGGYGDFSSVGKLNSGGSSSMLGPALGLVGSIGSSLLGGMFGNSQAAAQMRMQNAIANQQIIEGRNLGYGQLGSSIGNRVFGSTVAPDLDLQRQEFAKRLEMGPFAERELGLRSEQSKRDRLARISPESKEAAQFENRLAIQREIAARRAQTDAMFGPVRGGFA